MASKNALTSIQEAIRVIHVRIGKARAKSEYIGGILEQFPMLNEKYANMIFERCIKDGSLMYFKTREGHWTVRELPMGMKIEWSDN